MEVHVSLHSRPDFMTTQLKRLKVFPIRTPGSACNEQILYVFSSVVQALPSSWANHMAVLRNLFFQLHLSICTRPQRLFYSFSTEFTHCIVDQTNRMPTTSKSRSLDWVKGLIPQQPNDLGISAVCKHL